MKEGSNLNETLSAEMESFEIESNNIYRETSVYNVKKTGRERYQRLSDDILNNILKEVLPPSEPNSDDITTIYEFLSKQKQSMKIPHYPDSLLCDLEYMFEAYHIDIELKDNYYNLIMDYSLNDTPLEELLTFENSEYLETMMSQLVSKPVLYFRNILITVSRLQVHDMEDINAQSLWKSETIFIVPKLRDVFLKYLSTIPYLNIRQKDQYYYEISLSKTI